MRQDWDQITDEGLAEEMEGAVERFNSVAAMCFKRGINVSVALNVHPAQGQVQGQPIIGAQLVILNVLLARVQVLRPKQ